MKSGLVRRSSITCLPINSGVLSSGKVSLSVPGLPDRLHAAKKVRKIRELNR
jgi:hypothetical protein